MKRGILIALGLALAVAAVGCAGAKSAAVLGAAAMPSPEPSELSGAAAVNAFGFDLMRARLAASSSAPGNVVLSPLSVHAALSMTLQGANGTTAAEMQRTLHLSGRADAAASTYSLLLAALNDRSSEQTLSVANTLWIDKALHVKRDFLNANRIAFGASARALDFQHDDVVGAVNKWVDEKTHGMIPNIMDGLDPNAVMVLANAVHFKARWSLPFDANYTRPRPFHPVSGRPVDVPMMSQRAQLPVVESRGFSATRLKYSSGDSVAYIMLPDKAHRLDDVLSGLTSADFAALHNRLDSSPTTLTALELPKFDATAGGHIAETLAGIGMPAAFDPVNADFSGIAPVTPSRNIWIGDVVHKARMKVDEKGTEAAAATVVEMTCGAAPTRRVAPVPLPFVCDRPFAIAVVDTHSGALLFLAAIHNPTATD